MSSPNVVSHLGLQVVDVHRSATFYRDALGFTILSPGPVVYSDETVNTLLGTKDLRQNIQMIALGGFYLELCSAVEGAFRSTEPPYNPLEYGRFHLSVRVADVDETHDLVEKHGGTALRDTKVTIDSGAGRTCIAFSFDPDGNRVETISTTTPQALEEIGRMMDVWDAGWGREPLPGSR